MPRPPAKLTDDQQKALAALVAQAEKFHHERQQADASEELTWQMLVSARQPGISDELLCEQTGFSRATLNRRFGPRSSEETARERSHDPGC
jgi:hypothetical protein